MAFNESLGDRMRDALIAKDIPFEEKRMFGGLAFMVYEKMACGIVKDELMVRATDARFAEALARPHARQMDFTGRPMKGFLFVGSGGFESDADLAYWLEMGVEFAKAAPGKKAAKVQVKK